MLLKSFLLVFAGGGIGAVCRYAISFFMKPYNSIIWGTITSNIAGCLLLGFLYVILTDKTKNNELWNLLAVGFCGGFTTFSSFILEGYQLEKFASLTMLAGSIIIGFVALFLGIYLGRIIYH